MISLIVLATAAKAAVDMAVTKLVVMGISSAISVYATTKPRAYRPPRRKPKQED